VTDGAGCTSPPSATTDVTIVPAPCVNQPPVIVANTLSTTVGSQLDIDLLTLISDPDDNLVVSTLAVITPPSSGADATIANEVLTLDYSGVSFAGTDQLTVEACDVFGACTQEVLQVNVIGEITIFNAVSPNGDGKNDLFVIQSIDALPETQNNKLTILNRWGNVVFEATNYDNVTHVFKGLSSSGAELPAGTYYYILEFTGGAPKQTGFISLRR
jgi:gliding motility-associated-like protein